MHTGAFDAVEEEFFRAGDRLSNVKAETQRTSRISTGLPRAAARSRRPTGAAWRAARRAPSRAPRAAARRPRSRRHHLPAAIAASVLVVGLLARIASPTEDRALAATQLATATVPPTVAVVAPDPVPVPPPVPVITEPPTTEAEPAQEPAPAPAPVAEPAPSPPRLTAAQKRKRAAAAYAKGRAIYMEGDFRGSIRHFRRALDANPSHAKSHRAMGLAYSRIGDRARAERAFRAYLRAAPRAKDADAIRRMLAGR